MKSCDMEGISCWRGICQLRLWSVGRHGKTNFHTIPAHLFAHKTLVTSCHYDFEKPLPFLQPLTLDQFFLHPPTRSAPFLLIEKLWNFIISIFLLVVAARLLSMIVIAFYVVPFITRSERGVLFWVDGIPICCFYLRPRSWRFFLCGWCCNIPFEKNAIFIWLVCLYRCRIFVLGQALLVSI